MKIFLVILFVALSRSFPTLGGYESIDVEQAQSDPQIQSFIEDGLKAVVADGIKSEQFQSANFHLSKINSIMRQEDDGQNYKFDCYFMNDEGYTMRANFDINYKPDDDNTTVTNYSYKVQKGSLIQNVESQYSQVKYDEFENSKEQQNLVTYGIDDMIKKCIAKGYLPDLSYRVSSINWVYRQVYGNSIFYKCNVDMSGQDIGMNANFTVYYQPTNDNMTVVDYACDIKSQQYGDKDVYANTATIAPIESEYTKVPPSEWQNNAIAKEVLEYGAQQINKIAVEEGKIPDTDLSIGEVTSAESQIAGNGIYYRFKCKLTDEKGVTVWANYTVYYDAYSTEKDITNYWYESEITAQDNGEQEQEQQNDNEGELFISIFDEQGEFQPGEIDFVDVEEAEISVVSEQEEEPGKGGLSIFDQVFPLTAGQEPTGENVIVDNGGEEQDLEQDILIIDEGNVEEEEQQQQQEEETLFIDIDEGNVEEEEEEEPLFIDIDEGNVEQGVDEEASVSSSDDFQRINTNEVQTDQKTSAAFQYGVDQVTQKGKDESKIPNYDYSVTDITEAYKKTDTSGDYYKFRCQASSDEGSTLWLTFTVYYDGTSQDTSLVTYNYRVRNNAVGESETPVISTEDDYVECTQEEIQGDTVQGVLNYGIAQVYGYVQQERNIPVSEYSLSNVNSVYKQETSGGTSYKCDVVLENDDQDKINAQFTVYHDESSGKNSLSDYSYDIPDASEASEEANVGDDDLYKDINLNYLNLDDEYTQMLLFAIDVVIQKGYAAEKIPKSEYKISNIDYVKKRNGDDGENYYKCGIELQDANKVTISIKFTASIKMSDDYKKLWDWSYSVSDNTAIPVQDSQVPDSGYTQVNTDEVEYNTEIQDCIKYGVQQIIPNPQDYTLTKINSVYRQVIDSAIYYKYNIELTGDQKSADLSCTVYYKPDSGVKDVWAYSYSSKTSSDTTNAGNSEYQWWTDGSWESTSDSNPGLSWNSDANYEDMTSYKYDRLDVSQVQNNQKYHEALEYGVQQCLQNLVDNKVIANTNYNVDEVEDAYVQDNNNYENCKMKVKLSNSAGISLDMDFNVQYQSQGDDKTVTSYSVQGTSQGSSDVLVADYNIEDGGQLQIGNCEKVYPQGTEYPSSVQGAIDYGVKQVVDQVEQNENEDYSGYEVKDVKNVYQEVVNPDTYRVEATIENPEGSTIDCNFMVKYQPNADNNELVSYNYVTY